MAAYGVQRARTEVRTCGWLAQVDEHGGSIFRYRPLSKGAVDMGLLIDEVLEQVGLRRAPPTVVAATANVPVNVSTDSVVIEPANAPVTEGASTVITSPINPNQP